MTVVNWGGYRAKRRLRNIRSLPARTLNMVVHTAVTEIDNAVVRTDRYSRYVQNRIERFIKKEQHAN